MKLGESWHSDPRFEQAFHRFTWPSSLRCWQHYLVRMDAFESKEKASEA